ncbi:GNAT family N-acetyltransferase [Microlunatus flavus]|uniref:Predicted acetyltransferase n=1 Tax=Microlunatus flavus TaxID=1036181 RepID=A0A1H9KC84_9ACTN|nr:GNAT family N-acetyltransferase [Microlunatus flavus]SEQ96678.1 Predicted acetyltransferase [Microlunatus flavus]
MTTTVRRLGPEAGAASRRLSEEAFGVPATPSEPGELGLPGWHWWGVVDGDRLVAQSVDREFDGWFGGRVLPVAGIADVTVAAEARGAGVLAPMLLALLEGARERGAVVSTLWASAPHIYRRTGYEVVAATRLVDVPSAVLGAVRALGDVRLRRAEVADAERVRGLYDAWAASHDGALTRRGVSFPGTDEQLLARFTGITLAEDPDGRPLGYAAWVRGRGDGSGPELSVPDLVATHVDAYAALVRALASFGSVASTVRLRTTGDDLVRLLVPSLDWGPVKDELYSLKVLDVERAFTGARCAPGLAVELGFTVAGDVLPGLDGAYVVTASDGVVRCVRGPARDDRTLSPRGLALLVTGARPSRDLRVLGLLVGGDPAQDADWDALVAGRVHGVLDHF